MHDQDRGNASRTQKTPIGIQASACAHAISAANASAGNQDRKRIAAGTVNQESGRRPTTAPRTTTPATSARTPASAFVTGNVNMWRG